MPFQYQFQTPKPEIPILELGLDSRVQRNLEKQKKKKIEEEIERRQNAPQGEEIFNLSFPEGVHSVGFGDLPYPLRCSRLCVNLTQLGSYGTVD